MEWIVFQYGLLNAFDEFHLTIFWQYSHFGQVRFFLSKPYCFMGGLEAHPTRNNFYCGTGRKACCVAKLLTLFMGGLEAHPTRNNFYCGTGRKACCDVSLTAPKAICCTAKHLKTVHLTL